MEPAGPTTNVFVTQTMVMLTVPFVLVLTVTTPEVDQTKNALAAVLVTKRTVTVSVMLVTKVKHVAAPRAQTNAPTTELVLENPFDHAAVTSVTLELIALLVFALVVTILSPLKPTEVPEKHNKTNNNLLLSTFLPLFLPRVSHLLVILS